MARIWIKLSRAPVTGKPYRAVYLGNRFITSRWGMQAALDCALKLAAMTGAQIHRAEVLPFRKAVA